MTAPHYQASWFAPGFTVNGAHVSLAQLEQGRASSEAAYGPYQGVQVQPNGSFLIRYRKANVPTIIKLDRQGRVTEWDFGPPLLTHVSAGTAIQSLRRLPGRVSILVARNGVATTAINARQPLAVGSAFKLAVLLALRRQIAAGKLSWNQVVMLQAKDKNYGSQALQKQPAGARFTVAKLAAFMIAVSDNTAADMLIHLVGRAAIDPLIPARDRPILTTHEAFVLKDPARTALREQYLHGSPAQRRAVLAEADRAPLPPLSVFGRGLTTPEVEWFFSTEELCGLMHRVHDLPALHLNPGVADPKDWTSVAYKGGSEAGVLNLTTLVTARNGTSYCVSATWNNTALLNETQFEASYGSLLHALSR
jgi:beta-lactamase class A